MKDKTTVIFPKSLALKLRRIAVDVSEEEDKSISVSELVVRAVKAHYGIKDSKKETKNGK